MAGIMRPGSGVFLLAFFFFFFLQHLHEISTNSPCGLQDRARGSAYKLYHRQRDVPAASTQPEEMNVKQPIAQLANTPRGRRRLHPGPRLGRAQCSPNPLSERGGCHAPARGPAAKSLPMPALGDGAARLDSRALRRRPRRDRPRRRGLLLAAGHTVWVDEDYEAVEFSPSGPMGEVIDHLNAKLST